MSKEKLTRNLGELPSLKLAYQFVIPSYSNLLNRLAAVEDRIQRFMVFAGTLTAAIPLVVAGLKEDTQSLSVIWAIPAIVAFAVFMGVSIYGRWCGKITMINPVRLDHNWQTKKPQQFYSDIIKYAGKHYNSNDKLIGRKDMWANVAVVCFAVELICWVLWGYGILTS